MINNSLPSIGTGENRLEALPELGRPFRVGPPEALAMSNANVVRNALKERQVADARQWVEYLRSGDMIMLKVYAEWSVTWHEFANQRFGAIGAKALQGRALEIWSALPRTERGRCEAKSTLLSLFSELTDEADASQRIQLLSEGICKFPQEVCHLAVKSIEEGRWEEAEYAFEDYFKCVRKRHDLFAQYCWAFPTAIRRIHGQKIAEEALAGSFGAMSMQDAMWALFASLPPALRAAFLAEHLRFHFSGSDREGSVQIVEEPDRYRLIFDPCGSGGAMRRESLANDMDVFSTASPLTWGRTGEVPAYCAHCAFNELTSVNRVGYPLWVTEFNPDAGKPCGWSVFKDPDKIPANYFSRLSLHPPTAGNE